MAHLDFKENPVTDVSFFGKPSDSSSNRGWRYAARSHECIAYVFLLLFRKWLHIPSLGQECYAYSYFISAHFPLYTPDSHTAIAGCCVSVILQRQKPESVRKKALLVFVGDSFEFPRVSTASSHCYAPHCTTGELDD